MSILINQIYTSDSADSTDTDSDELTEVEANPLEEVTEEDHPLMVDPSITMLQLVEGKYVSDAGQEIKKARKFRCTCKSNEGKPCNLLFTPEEMVKRRDQIN